MTRTARRWVLAAAVALIALGAVGYAGGSAGGARRPAPPAPDCGPAIKRPGGGYWTCTFADDFSGTALDRNRWTAVTTAQNGVSGGPACYVDSPANIAVGGGYLTLTARREDGAFSCTGPNGAFTTQYTSGQVATYGRFAQTYGRFAARARFPATTVAGLQATLWLWPQNPIAFGTTGEVDFAEWYSGFADQLVPYLHYAYDPQTTDPATGVNVPTNNCPLSDPAAFHEYAVDWSASTFTITVDGRTCLVDRYRPSGADPFRQPYFIALSQALGVTNNAFADGTTPLPGTTTIDWVRAWK
jgi:beta-glucanase (GH16 family)